MKKTSTLQTILFIALMAFYMSSQAANINVSGNITSNTSWNADTVKVYSNITVSNGVYLNITAGTYVKFMGHYSLNIQGQLRARGTKSNRIVFSANNTTTGWAGIRFDNTPTANTQSYIEYCTITYGKANTGTSEEKMGGAIFVKGTSDLLIRNNIITNNTASNFGGGITCRYGASPTIANNIICNNSANSYGGGIYLYSNALPKISNNTIANNTASQGGAIYGNQSNPYIYSNILAGNLASSNAQLNTGLTLVNYNIIQGGYSGSNYNISPNFVSPTSGKGILYDGVAADWSLQSNSYAIDKGYPYANTVQSFFNVPNFDAYGNFRFDNDRVDIGAVEYISSTEACGHISSNTTWSGNVLVNCNVYVDNGKTLTIQPGTKITFTGHFTLYNYGRILAQGTSQDNIVFTAWDKTEGWNGIYMYNNNINNGTTKFEFCDISYSRRSGYGGAFYINKSSNIWIRSNKIRNNSASIYGGGLYIKDCSPYIIGNLIINNEALGNYGGGIYMTSTSTSYHPYIYNNTISRNKCNLTGAGLFRYSSIVPYLRNNIIWGNEDDLGNHAQIDNIYPTTGLNVLYCDIEGGYSGTGNKSLNPLFKNATSSAGINGSTNYANFSISDLSPCVDQGTTYSLTNQPNKDIIGRDRIYNSRIDMGAYEEKALLTLSCSSGTSTISSDQTWDASVVEVNCNVEIQNGATVTINPGTKIKFNGNYSITVNGAIIAKGTSSDKIVFTPANTTIGWDGMYISPLYGNDSTIFDYCKFEYSKRTTATTTNGGGALTLRNDRIRISNSEFYHNETSGRGGAIQIYQSSALIKSNIFKYNTGGDGGAIYVFYVKSNPSDHELFIIDNLMYSNTATNGGAMYFYAPNATVINNKMINNSASKGGAIYYRGNRTSYLSGNLIANNYSSTNGGGVYMTDCKAYFTNSTIVNNSAGLTGGGVYCVNNSDPIFNNSIVYGNYNNSSSYTSNQFKLMDILSDPRFYDSDIEGGKAAFTGTGAGVEYKGVYKNVISVNPNFLNPTAGYGVAYNALYKNFALQQGSACINKGGADNSLMVLPSKDLGGDDRVFNKIIDIGAYENQQDIISPCSINSDIVWDADVIKVNCNVIIGNNATLYISAGTKVLFTGKYSLTVNGAIQAIGTATEPIEFTASNLTNFSNLSIDQGGWSGIRILSPSSSNDSSIFKYCNFTYGKASGSNSVDKKGGAMYIFDYSNVAVVNCKFSNNAARVNGGALCIESSNIIFHNNLVVNNHADNTNNGEGGGLRIDDSSIDFKNNTIANNSSKYGAGVFIYSSSSPNFEGSIFYGNQTIGNSFGRQIHTLLCSNSSFINCDIQGGKTGISDYQNILNYIGNYNVDPSFINPTTQYGLQYNGLNADWKLKPNSDLINKSFVTFSNQFDLAGQPRSIADTLDIGAYEVQMSPRFITEQPEGNKFCLGTSAIITTNSSIAASYQWQKNGVSIVGAENKKLYIASIMHADTAFYNCIISSNYGSVSTDTVWVGTKVAPSVVSHPSATSSCIGSSATFSATVDGTSPISYQWYNTNGALGAGTNSSFTIVSSTANDASTYKLKAINSCGSVFTNGALLSINTVPTLTTITAAADVCENGSNTFTTSATGSTPITYQWYKSGSTIGGATSVSYSISNASTTDAGTYYCKATNLCGNDQTNQSVLSVKAVPSISVQPSSATVCEGQSYTFSITSSGAAPLTYQWYKGGVAINNANNNSYTISSIISSDATSYYCVVTNSCNSATSSTASLTVNSSPNISSQTSSIDVCSGSAAPFSITASGTAPLTYQWYNSSGSIASATANTYTIGSATTSDASNYYCKVTNSCGSDWTTSIPLTVRTSPSISSQTSSLAKCEGQSALFDIQATGSNPLTYQWKKGGSSISGAVSSSLLISPVTSSDNASYLCTVSNSCGSASSSAASLVVNSNATITSQSSSQTLCEGASPSLSVTASGTAPLTYQWYDNSGAISSATNNTYSLASIDTSDAGNYYCKVTNMCTSSMSSSIAINVNQAPSVVSNPQSATVCQNYSAVFTVSTNGTTPMTYQWFDGSGAISGATSTTYIIPQVNSSDAGNYYVKATNTCGIATSTNASLTVNDNVSITAQSSSLAVCDGASPSFSITATGTAPITYQWYKDGATISGATNNTYSMTSVDTSDDASYYVIATNSCNSVQSNTMILTVSESPSIITQPLATNACAGSSAMLSISADGTGPLSYQWYKGGTAIAGAVSNTYIIGSSTTTDAGSYYCKASNSCAIVTSNTAVLTVNNPAIIVSQSSDSTKCVGNAMIFTVSTQGTAPISYQWYHNGSSILGASSATYNIANVATNDAGDYYCITSNACNTSQSSIKVLTVNTAPAITQQSSDTTICSSNNLTLNVVSSGSAPMSYQWYKGTTAIGGAINSLYPMYQISTNDAATYYCEASNNCGSAQSSNMVVTVNTAPSITFQSADSTRCEGDAMTFQVATTGTAPISYQWYQGSTSINGGDTSIYHINNVAVADNGIYHVEITNSCASISSAYKYLTVNPTPIVNLGNDTSFCDGGSVIIGPGYGYYCLWNNGQIASQLNITSTGSYSATITDQYGCNGVTDTINVNVVLPYANQEICVVTVDSATGKNVIVWQKTPNMAISSFNVYKESNVSGVYNLLKNRPYDSLSVVFDLASNPMVNPERYAITVVDSCGNESPKSPAHRTMHVTVNKGQNNDWNLIWNAYEGFTPSSYKIFRADTSLNYVNIATVSGSSSYTYLYTDQTALANKTYYYYVEIVHPSGGCSITKGKTSYNSSRSNRANNGMANPSQLVPAFFGTPTSGKFPLDVHFFDQSQGSPIEWEWNFGDGNIDTVQNPTHTYTQIGVYTVSLVVKDAAGVNSIAFQNYITILTTGISEIDNEFVVKVFPNPYSDKTNIAYALTNQEKVVIEVYTSHGQKVAELVNGLQAAGSYKYQFRAADYGFASGVYVLRMKVGDKLITKKLIEVK